MSHKTRKYLSETEINKMINQTQDGINSARDSCIIIMCFIHGLRASELCQLTIEHVELTEQRIFIPRLKNGLSVQHPLQPDEITILRKWLDKRAVHLQANQPWLFLSRKGGRLSRQQVYRLIRKYGEAANLACPAHPHMLRHSCGYSLADRGIDTRLIQDYLGHRNIQHTVLYTASNAKRFEKISF
ncbi:tyrosine-type DNA invertase [Serratia rubidaea]|uniref:tyrosine-type DNA invertase n=1 Tax=Serratia rubidaea TaxID=61652 RepID=UPI0023B153D0|nr:tyrosine-type DNA invertase [Serratia rubidaea]MDK1705096.1 tyrosine-type DNA invertase [Serratia rubidaea]